MDMEPKADTIMKMFHFDDSETEQFVQGLTSLNLESTYYLILLTGPYLKGKKKFLEKLADIFNRSVTHVDLHDIVTMNEAESRQNIDDLFDSLDETDSIIFFSNGDRLCGSYTGYTHSSTRYATPQERHFLKKIPESEKVILMDIRDEDNVDKTLERFSHASITFDKPTSPLKRLTWNLGNISFHGHKIVSKRPKSANHPMVKEVR